VLGSDCRGQGIIAGGNGWWGDYRGGLAGRGIVCGG
jgi:hypothetical protein